MGLGDEPTETRGEEPSVASGRLFLLGYLMRQGPASSLARPARVLQWLPTNPCGRPAQPLGTHVGVELPGIGAGGGNREHGVRPSRGLCALQGRGSASQPWPVHQAKTAYRLRAASIRLPSTPPLPGQRRSRGRASWGGLTSAAPCQYAAPVAGAFLPSQAKLPCDRGVVDIRQPWRGCIQRIPRQAVQRWGRQPLAPDHLSLSVGG